MSDSHVNDIRYTALWRPVVKAREAPAASPPSPPPFPSPSPPLGSRSRFSLSVACGLVMCGCAFPFSFPLGNPALECRARAMWISQTGSGCGRGDDRKFYLLWWKARRERMLSLRGARGGGGTVRDNCVPLRTQQPCVSPSGTRCCLCGDDRLSLMTHRRSERLPFARLANRPKSISTCCNIFI